MIGEPRARFRILLVDDESIICRTLERLLKGQARFEVRTASTYEGALQVFASEGPFDLLLTDLGLKTRQDGVELAQQLLASKPDLRVVFMSGDVPPEFAATYRSIEKPFDRGKLVEILEEALLAPHGELK